MLALVVLATDAVIWLGRGEYVGAGHTLGHDRIHRLGNGVDVERFAHGDGAAFRAKHGLPPDAVVVACYSWFDPQKDQLALLEAFEKLAPDFEGAANSRGVPTRGGGNGADLPGGGSPRVLGPPRARGRRGALTVMSVLDIGRLLLGLIGYFVIAPALGMAIRDDRVWQRRLLGALVFMTSFQINKRR